MNKRTQLDIEGPDKSRKLDAIATESHLLRQNITRQMIHKFRKQSLDASENSAEERYESEIYRLHRYPKCMC